MSTEDSFKTIASPSEALFKDRGSKFLGYAFPIKSDTEARRHWLYLKELHPKAVHWCYAYRLGTGRDQYRANDDGEPSGSAGKPILNVLYSQELTNVIVIVVRYFGGTLLGVPGLINAYKTTAEMALKEAEIIVGFVTVTLRISFLYESMNAVMKAVKEFDLEVLDPIFEMSCQLDVNVKRGEKDIFIEKCYLGENVTVEEINN